MQITIQLILEDEAVSKRKIISDVLTLAKDTNEPQLGLTILESKDLLSRVQEIIVHQQAQAINQDHQNCPCCGSPRRLHSHQQLVYRTLFGTFTLDSPRVYACACRASSAKTTTVLGKVLSERTTPEMQYLQTKWASLMSYGLTTNILKDILPIGKKLNASSVRNNLVKAATRREHDIKAGPKFEGFCQNDLDKLPKPGQPITVGIDGGYLRNWQEKRENFEVIAGKTMSKTMASNRFGFLDKSYHRSRNRIFGLLTEQGVQLNQQITFLSDGAETLRLLQENMYPEAEYVLDWFHIVRQEVA